MWGLHDATNFDFVRYAYLLLGPIVLYLGTSVMTPDVERDIVDMRTVYWQMRTLYFSISALVWAWALVCAFFIDLANAFLIPFFLAKF